MKLLYLSNALPDELYHKIFAEKKGPSPAAQKYHILQIEGLVACGAEITAVSVPPVSRKTYDGWLFRCREKTAPYHIVPIINIPILRNLCMFFYLFFYTLRHTMGRKQVAVLCDVLNTTNSAAILLATFFTRKQAVGIVTDVSTKRAFAIKNPLKRILARFSFFLLGRYDKYVFLTQAMNELINRKNRPYLVSEGHADSRQADVENSLSKKYEKKVCMYAGSLRRIYGVASLTEAFLQANVPNTELHIYGSGDYEEELCTLCQSAPSIKFFGIQPNSHIVAEEYKASLLVNPRPTNEEYTQYSFPSKNMEYMASGTPILTTRLPGMPKEYYPYVYLIEPETTEALAQTLRTLLAKPSEELFAFGQAAKAFILQEKNNLRQAEKLLHLLKET